MSAVSLSTKTVEEQARFMVSIASEDDPAILRAYWFPADDQVRIVYVDETALPRPKVEPFYFPGKAAEGRPHWSAIASSARKKTANWIFLKNGPTGQMRFS